MRAFLNIQMKAKDSPSLTELEETFEIDETSPSGLRWKTKGRKKTNSGKIAGHPTIYWSVVFKKLKYRVHRIIYQMSNKIDKLDGNVIIDHIDGDRQNNNISNLRISTPQQNRWNSNRENKIPSYKSGYYSIMINFRKDQYTLQDVIEIKNKFSRKLYGKFSITERYAESSDIIGAFNSLENETRAG